MWKKTAAKTGLLAGVIFGACLLLTSPAYGFEVDGNYHGLSHHFEYLPDPAGKITLQQILENPDSHRFTSAADSHPEPGYSPVWLRLKLNFSETTKNRSYYLFSMAENLYDLRLYRPGVSGQYTESRTGNDYPASTRELDSPRYGFKVDSSPHETTVYLRMVGGPGTEKFPWVLLEENSYEHGTSVYYAVSQACLAAIAALLLFNLGLAVSLRSPAYGYYSLFILSVTLALITHDGLGFYYLWPELPALNERALHSINLVSASARLMAITSLLAIPRLAPRLWRGCKAILGLLLTCGVLVLAVGVKSLPIYLASTVWAVGILTGFVACGYAIRLRTRLAIPLFIALLLPALGAVLQAALTVKGVGSPAIVLQLAKLSFVAHVLLFSLCLATQIKIETESKIQAMHDSLTGLPGPAILAERFEQAAHMARRQKWEMAVFFLDLDGFKAVNDNQGHKAGDALLKELSARIKQCLRRSDTVARIGGDEFAVLLPEISSLGSVSLVAEKLLNTISAPYWIDHQTVSVSASIGIAAYGPDGEDLPALLSAADTAMYEAKRSGKNRYAFAKAPTQEPSGTTAKLRVVG